MHNFNVGISSAPAAPAFPTGVVFLSGAGAPVDGVAGTGAGTARPGSRYLDTATNIEYRQNGTLASPVWNAIHAP